MSTLKKFKYDFLAIRGKLTELEFSKKFIN
jgi:hypothetical protein